MVTISLNIVALYKGEPLFMKEKMEFGDVCEKRYVLCASTGYAARILNNGYGYQT